MRISTSLLYSRRAKMSVCGLGKWSERNITCFIYCFVCTGFAINKMQQVLQNRAIRTINNRHNYVSSQELDAMHHELHLDKLDVRRKYFMLKMMHKYSQVAENVDIYRGRNFVRGNRKVKLKLPFSDKTRVLQSPYYRSVHVCLWNQLDYKLQHIESTQLFGKAVKKLDLKKLKMCMY